MWKPLLRIKALYGSDLYCLAGCFCWCWTAGKDLFDFTGCGCLSFCSLRSTSSWFWPLFSLPALARASTWIDVPSSRIPALVGSVAVARIEFFLNNQLWSEYQQRTRCHPHLLPHQWWSDWLWLGVPLCSQSVLSVPQWWFHHLNLIRNHLVFNWDKYPLLNILHPMFSCQPGKTLTNMLPL